jgi:hypothetical protein
MGTLFFFGELLCWEGARIPFKTEASFPLWHSFVIQYFELLYNPRTTWKILRAQEAYDNL